MDKPKTGQIDWIDLSAPDAEGLRAFYQKVVGWTDEPVEMDGYSDYCMTPPGSDSPVAGICHARGSNADLPAQWLIYVTVDNLDESLKRVTESGGEVIGPVRNAGPGSFAVIRDPAGAVCALYEAPPSES